MPLTTPKLPDPNSFRFDIWLFVLCRPLLSFKMAGRNENTPSPFVYRKSGVQRFLKKSYGDLLYSTINWFVAASTSVVEADWENATTFVSNRTRVKRIAFTVIKWMV